MEPAKAAEDVPVIGSLPIGLVVTGSAHMLKRLIACAIASVVAPGALAADNPTYDAVLAGKTCSEVQQQLNCKYRVGKSLSFEIVGIGMPDTAVTFYRVDWDGDYYASLGIMHGCVIVKPGKKTEDGFAFAFVSPGNGKVYRSWEECRDRT
jgi:hypothetical protein